MKLLHLFPVIFCSLSFSCLTAQCGNPPTSNEQRIRNRRWPTSRSTLPVSRAFPTGSEKPQVYEMTPTPSTAAHGEPLTPVRALRATLDQAASD